jgi:hypothetical protein
MGLLAGYNIWTNLNFFKGKAKWLIVLKSIANIFIGYLAFQFVAESWMKLFSNP